MSPTILNWQELQDWVDEMEARVANRELSDVELVIGTGGGVGIVVAPGWTTVPGLSVTIRQQGRHHFWAALNHFVTAPGAGYVVVGLFKNGVRQGTQAVVLHEAAYAVTGAQQWVLDCVVGDVVDVRAQKIAAGGAVLTGGTGCTLSRRRLGVVA